MNTPPLPAPLSAKQEKALKRWFDEREMLLSLLAEDEQLDKKSTEKTLQPEPFAKNIAEGDVLILAATDDFGEPMRFIYVAVLAEWPGREWLMAPFSPYSTPAARGEWSTGSEFIPLQTLCLWNARNLTFDQFSCCWKAGELTQQQCTDALDVFRYITRGIKPRPEVWDNMGAPIMDPLDERAIYQNEEARIFSSALQQIAERAERDNIIYIDFHMQAQPEPIPLALAADDGETTQLQLSAFNGSLFDLALHTQQELTENAQNTVAATDELPLAIKAKGKLREPLLFKLAEKLAPYRRVLMMDTQNGSPLLKGSLASSGHIIKFTESLTDSAYLRGSGDAYILLCDPEPAK